MLKEFPAEIWVFDAEWVPDPPTGRRVYQFEDSVPDEDVIAMMWQEAGATETNPQPFLKTVLCRVVSIASVIRKTDSAGNISHTLCSLPCPADVEINEGELISRFLTGVGKNKPQLVGFNSQSSDLIILIQRALINRLSIPEFCKRPQKPWEGIDYFVKYTDYHIDLKNELSSWGKTTPTLHELATSCGIPGKLGANGQDVIHLWRSGNIRQIVQYNECDALSTFLLFLRLAHFAGKLNSNGLDNEEQQIEQLIEQRIKLPNNDHLYTFLETWRRLRA